MKFGDYELRDLLGHGAGGEVWRAHDPHTGRIVALRLLPPECATDSELARRVLGQARAAAALNNPHLVPVHAFGQTGGRLFIDMRLIAGPDLRSTLDIGPLGADEATSIVEDVASALQSAHRAGLAHGTVRPSNIMVTDDGFAYLADLGMGLVGASSPDSWPYLAPERSARQGPTRHLTCIR